MIRITQLNLFQMVIAQLQKVKKLFAVICQVWVIVMIVVMFAPSMRRASVIAIIIRFLFAAQNSKSLLSQDSYLLVFSVKLSVITLENLYFSMILFTINLIKYIHS